MIKTIQIYSNNVIDIDRAIDTLFSIKGIKDVKYLSKSILCFESNTASFKIKHSFLRSDYIDKEIFKRFPKALIFNEKGRRIK